MESIPTSIDTNMLLSAAILVVIYVLIFSELLHRTSSAIIGAALMVGVGMMNDFYSQEQAIRAIDGNTILLLAAMMVVVAMLRPTGAFEYAAIRLTKWSRGNPRLLLIYLCLFVSLISMILDNVTTVIVFAPITVLICRILKLNPMPFLIAEAMLSNIGGAATLVGDPPNLMIGSAGHITFLDFLLNMGPIILMVWFATVGLLLVLFRTQLTGGYSKVELDESQAIRDPSALRRVMLSLALVVTLFFVHHHLNIYPAFAAIIGLCLALILLRPEPEELFGSVNWSVLIFFAGLFIIVGGVAASGLLDLLGRRLASLANEPGMLLVSALIIMWVAAVISAIVDNIPFTITMIPIILGLEQQGVNIMPLWWALAIGVGLGGNGTHIGATANLIVVAESEQCDIAEARITPAQWLRLGIPTTFFSLVVASILYTLLFQSFL